MLDFWEIYDHYYRPVRTFIAAMVKDDWTADDLLHDTFLKVQNKLDTLQQQNKIKSWIYSIARNQCLDHFRRAAASKEQNGDSHDGFEGVQPPLVQIQLERQEMSRCVQDKMLLLPESHRTVLVLFDTLDLTHQEIADVLGVNKGAVKVRLHRARKAFREILERDCTFEQDERNVLVCNPREERQ